MTLNNLHKILKCDWSNTGQLHIAVSSSEEGGCGGAAGAGFGKMTSFLRFDNSQQFSLFFSFEDQAPNHQALHSQSDSSCPQCIHRQ